MNQSIFLIYYIIKVKIAFNSVEKKPLFYNDFINYYVRKLKHICQCKISLPTQVYMLVYEYLGYRR